MNRREFIVGSAAAAACAALPLGATPAETIIGIDFGAADDVCTLAEWQRGVLTKIYGPVKSADVARFIETVVLPQTQRGAA